VKIFVIFVTFNFSRKAKINFRKIFAQNTKTKIFVSTLVERFLSPIGSALPPLLHHHPTLYQPLNISNSATFRLRARPRPTHCNKNQCFGSIRFLCGFESCIQ
jgi:hypothetical protein